MSNAGKPSIFRFGPDGVIFAGFIGGLLFLLWFLLTPNFVRSGPSKTSGIFNNLRQIDGAKQQWAYENHQTNDVVVPSDHIAKLLRRRIEPVAGEQYIINTLWKSPEAVLTRELGGRPKGTIFRIGTNLGEQIILPKRPGADAGRRDLFAFQRRWPRAAHAGCWGAMTGLEISS